MPTLDIRTLSFLAMLTSLLLAVGLQLVNRVIKRDPALRFWAMGSTAMGVGFVLLALRGLIPEQFSILLANTLLAVGSVWQYLGNRAFQGRKSEFPWYWWLVAVSSVLFIYFTYLSPSLAARFVVTSAIVAALRFASAWVLLLPPTAQDRLVRWSVAGAFLLNAIYLGTLAIGCLSWGPTDQNLMSATAASQTFAFVFEIGLDLALGIGMPLLVLGRAQRKLLGSEQRYRSLIENTPVSIGIIDGGKLRYANPAAIKMFGALSLHELVGKPLLDLVHPDFRQVALERARSALETGTGNPVAEERFLKLDGTSIVAEVQSTPVLYDDEAAVQVVINDITQRRRAEESANALLTRMQLLAEHLPGFVYQYQLTPDGSSAFPYASPGIQAIYGVSPKDVVQDAKPVFAVLHPEDLVRIATSIQLSADTLTLWHETYRVNHPSGHMLWVEGHATPVRQGDGSTLWHGYIHDVSKRLQAEQAAHDSEAFAQNVLNSMQSQIAVIDHTGTIVSVNETWRQFSRQNSPQPGLLTPATDIGTNYLKICSGAGDDARDARSGILAVLEGDQPRFVLEFPCPAPSGERWFSMSVTPLSVGIKGAVIAHSDITTKKAGEQQLAQQSQSLANILWGTGVGTWEWNVQTGQTRFNERWAELIGYTLEELAPISIATWMKYAHPDDLAASGAALEQHFSGAVDAYECESRMQHKDGHWVWVLDRGKLVSRTPDGQPEWMAGTHGDISDRKQSEAALLASEARHANMVANISDVIGIIGVDGLMAYKSPNIEKHFGWKPSDLVGASGWNTVHPDDLARIQQAFYTLLLEDNASTTVVYRYLCKDGSYKPIELTANNLTKNPSVGGVLLNYRDITEREQAERALRLQTEALAHSNAELEQFAYVASHDLRQPLRMVNSYVQLLERRLANTLDEDTRKMMHFATEGATRMDQMLVSLLDYSRVGRKGEPMAALASRAALDEALHFLAPVIADAQATVRVSGDWPQLVASRDEFTRLWQNLIGNAIKYRAPERAPEIDITVTPEEQGWRFCVADNGIGIDPAQFDRLFKVFARLHTREQYEGNGIGLAVARKIVERHGGLIWVESDGAGMGSRFCFSLPGQTIEATV